MAIKFDKILGQLRESDVANGNAGGNTGGDEWRYYRFNICDIRYEFISGIKELTPYQPDSKRVYKFDITKITDLFYIYKDLYEIRYDVYINGLLSGHGNFAHVYYKDYDDVLMPEDRIRIDVYFYGRLREDKKLEDYYIFNQFS